MINNNLTLTEKTNLLRQQRLQKIEDAKRIEEEQKITNKKNNASIWEKIGDTLYDFGANIVGGASKAIEGVVDTGSTVAGTVAGWFGADDFKQQMQENIAYDWTGNNITNPANEKTDASLLNDSKFGQYVEGVAQGVGQLLPNVVLTVATGGTATGIKIGSIASKITLFGSAMGNSTEQAVNEGADLGTASVYGALSGGVELLSERISGKLFGATKIDKTYGFKQNLGRSLFKSAKSGLGRMAQEAVGEGLEEAFAEAVNPLLKKWTYDPDTKGATFSEICDSAVVGALTSIAFGGTVGQLPTYKNASRLSRVQDQVNEYNDKVDKLYQDSTTGKINAEEKQARQAELEKERLIVEAEVAKIVAEFDKGYNITEKIRQKGKQEALKVINASGNLKMGLNSEGKLQTIQDKINPNNSPYNVLASGEMAHKVSQTKTFMQDANTDAVSSNLAGQEHLIQYKPTSRPLTSQMKNALNVFADFSKAKGQNQKYVIVDKDSMPDNARGFAIDDTGVVYLREDLDSSKLIDNLAQATAVHEFSHGLEDTSSYKTLTKFVFTTLAKNPKLAKQFGIDNFESDYNRIAKLYATNENTRDAFQKKSLKEQREYIQSEYMAKFLSEKAFTDSKSIKALCRTNQTLGQKILNWLSDFVDRLKSVNKVERQMKVFLQRARNLYSTAMQEAGNLQARKNIAYALNDQNLDKNSGLDYSNNIKYSTEPAKYIPYNKISRENITHIKNELKKIYGDISDGIANGIAIDKGNKIFIIDSAIDNSEIRFGLRSQRTISDDSLRIEVVRRINNESISKGYISDELSSKLRNRYDNSIGSDRRQKFRTKLSLDSEESINNKNRISQTNENQKLKNSALYYGDGYSTENVNPDEYNLIDVKDKEQFKILLSNLVRQVKSGVEVKTGANMNLRHGLFNCLQNQKNNIYSKLAEINTAYEKTVSAYNKNNSINIPQTFIQALGYNGVIDGKDSVVYDLNNKKKNLLDYSEDRAKERLDRAIRLFGETDNPAKAGWLLADGRFVDYHRDSANIFTGNILDYEDHWQIEKVFDTRRGTDAIDAFMAEGNIRLMPEAGGIELRGKPNKNQIDKLEDFINKVIDKEGITLDLRPAGTTENHKPNPVSYDSTASAKEIMQDINSYYNTGKIAKVVDGVKFSLDEDIDSMLKDWWDNLSLEDLNEMIQDELKDFDTKEEVKLSKEERRELYVKKLYEEGKLNSVVTKLVNKNPQMKEYFKDTQMNMKYNPLSMLRTKGDEYIVMFHGTPNKNFNEFSPSFIGDNGSVMGEGFYFTESLEYANDYKQRDGRVIATLLDIKKPLSRNKVTITKDELKTFIQDVLVKHKKNYLENFNNDIDFTVDYWINHYDNDIDLIQGMHEHSVVLWEDFYSGLRDSIGYDGVIAWNKAEGTQAIVFNSNQIKDIFNHKPTKSADIRYALEEDSDGNKLSEAQVEFFKDSKVRDENGNLLVMYHGTPNYFNEFIPGVGGLYGSGIYFTEDLKYAEGYKQSLVANGKSIGGRIIKSYINLKNPLVIENQKDLDNIYDSASREKVNENGISYSVRKENFNFDNWIKESYDGIIINNPSSDLTSASFKGKFVVAFESNQIKNIDNKKPTQSTDIRFSVEDSEGNKLSEEQAEYFKDSKVRDENGNLLVVYHGTNKSFNKFKRGSKGYLGGMIYLTDNQRYAEKYTDYGIVKTGYANIKSPAILTSNNATKELLKLIYGKDSIYENRKAKQDYDTYLITKSDLSKLQKKGYDGIIWKFSDENEIAIFESNQFKNLDNKNPTDNADIRYSLIESDGKELVALHNLSEEKLRNSIALGGLPVPSIAITKAEYGHSNFGEITLVFKPDTINPEKWGNKVYSADAYSKRFPRTVTKFSDKAIDELEQKFKDSYNLLYENRTIDLSNYLDKENINDVAYNLARKDFVKLQYLKDNNIQFEPVYKEFSLNEYDEPVVKTLVEKYPDDVKGGYPPYDFITKLVIPDVIKARKEYYSEKIQKAKQDGNRRQITLYENYLKNVEEDTTYSQVTSYFTLAREYMKKQGSQVLNERATEEKLYELTKNKHDDIEKYVKGLLSEYDEGLYFRNNKEIFTPSGNRRSFEQLYNKVSLSSIVEYMSGSVQNTEGWSYGVGNVRSLLTKQYKTLEDIRADKDKIISSDEMDTLKKQSQDLYFELCYEVAPGDPDAGDEIIKEISEKPYNEKSILRVLKQYDSAVEDPEVIEHIIEFLDQLKDYPTEYFEAKPQRAVMFDEVAKLIAPQTTSNDIIDFFKKKGVEIALYEYDDDDSNRRNIIKNLPGDMRFSVEDDVDNKSNKNYTENSEVEDGEQRGSNSLFGDRRWSGEDSRESSQNIRARQEKLQTKKSRTRYEKYIQERQLFKTEKRGNYFVDVIDKSEYTPIMKDVDSENKALETNTEFFVGSILDIEGRKVCAFYDNNNNTIYLPVNDKYTNLDFITFNRHERIHKLSRIDDFLGLSNYFDDLSDIMTDEEGIALQNKYKKIYPRLKPGALSEEIMAQIYNNYEQLSDVEGQRKATKSLNDEIKKYFGLKELKYSFDDDFDISDYYIPSDDGFFNAENPKLKGQERDTEAIKYRAKLKQNKVFSREELEKVIDDAINQKQNIRLTGKRRETAIGELFKRMNTQDVYEKRKTAQDIANFIINNVFYDEIYTDTYEQQVAEFEMIDYYKGHFELNNQIKQELEYRTENGARIINAWKEKGVNKLSDGTTKAKPGVNPHDVAQDLNDNGLKIDMDKSETEIFLDIYDRYNALDEAIKEFKKQQKELAINKLESSTMKSYRDDLIETILRAYDEKGSKTPYAKLKETYQTNLQNIKAELKDVKKYANAYVNYLVSNKRAKELVKGNKHYSAGVLENPTLKGFLEVIAQTGNIKTIKRTARARIQKLAEVYNTSKKGSLFNDILGQEQEMTEIFGVKDSVYDENIANMIEYIAQGQGELTTDEIILLTKITDGLIHLYKTYDKVFKNDEYVETEKLAKEYGEKMRVGVDVRNKSKLLKGMWRFRAMFDPHTVMRNLDGYRCEYNEDLGVIEDRGFFTEMFQDITDGEVKANVAELELLKPFGDFFKSHKGFEKGLTKDKIKLNGTQIKTNGVKVKTEVEMSVGEAISIYLTSLRPQSNFYDSSVILQNKDKTTSEYSFDVKQINELFGKFTEAQKQYIKLVQKFFNEEAQKLKVETDLLTLGYTNIEDSGVYFPINREKSAIAKNIGDTQVILDAINTYTLSFNKDVRPGAKLPIRISNVYGIVQNHARGMGAYYGLSIPLKTFNRVFNKQIESMGKQSLKRIASSQMYDSVKYIDQLLKDIQGRQYDNTIGGKALRWMRGNYAKFQLGFNPKTILGQTSSYMMASTYLDADALAKGLVMKTNTEQMFKYAPFTRYRMQEKTIVKAQGVIDKVDSWTDTFTKGIEWMDNNVVKKLWNASQVQIEKNTGHKIGTEENLKRASKLLEMVVRETQSNSIASEKTSLARSENEVIASLTMFSSDSQKQVSRLVDGLGLLSARKQWIANGTIKADDKIAKVAKKQIFRAGAGYVTATTMFVLIGMMMKHLLGKNDEDETITEEFFGDFKTQVAGLIPIYRDVYGFMNDGYELDNYAYGMINDALQGAKSMKNLAEDIISGKQLSKSEIGIPARKAIYGITQLLGVPVRNVWNYGYGIINQFSPSTAYRMNSLFYDAKLTDLEKSIESGNDRKSLTIIKELFESKNLDIDNTYAKEVLELYKDGVNVIPGEIKETFTYNGEELTLTSAQHKQLLNAMNDVLAGFNDVVKQAEYKKLSATQKRTYLNNLYDINYILNVAKIIGLNNMKDSDIKKFLFANVLGSDLIGYMAYIKTFESDKDKEGNTITNSKKTKIQNWVKRLKLTPAEKYLLMGFAGYKNINGESAVNGYLRRKGLSKDEIELVLKWCGY